MNEPLEKNGRDHAQDQRINDLAEGNAQEHRSLLDMINQLSERTQVGFERIEGKLTTHRTVIIVAWMIFMALGGYIFELQSNSQEAIAGSLKETARTVQQLDKRQEAWEALATEWGKSLEKRDDQLERKHDRDIDHINGELRRKQR